MKEDGSYEATLTLPHSQGISVDNTSFVFLAVGDTLEMMIDASKPDLEGVTFGGHGASTNINRLWPEVGKHYFGSTQLTAREAFLKIALATACTSSRVTDLMRSTSSDGATSRPKESSIEP